MVIIMGKIVKVDILPFLVFATTAVVAFEAASLFFAWVLEFPHEIGTFFRMFTGVGKSQPRLSCWPLVSCAALCAQGISVTTCKRLFKHPPWPAMVSLPNASALVCFVFP